MGYDAAAMTFKRRVLSGLGKAELLEIGRGLELEVTTRMTLDELRDVIAGSKRAKLGVIVTEGLSRDTLKEICRACGLDDTGEEKRGLVERILAAGGVGDASGAADDGDVGYQVDGGNTSAAADAGPKAGVTPELLKALGSLPGLGGKVDAGGAGKKGKKAKDAERRRGGVPESEAFISGSLKAALRQFTLAAAGGYRGRDGATSFTTHLLECFGWAAGRPEGAIIPHTLRVAEAGAMVDREVALWWRERRTMLAVVPHDVVLDFAWKDLLRACLQSDPPPQYVVVTNQRDLQLYDLARDRDAPRLAIAIDDLPKYSEAFPFFTTTWAPGQTPRIVNVEKVSTEVADLVARLYRSVFAQYPDRQHDVIRFVLQCITAMFAEDIGLLPRSYFTSLLYDGAREKNLDRGLHELFVQMNTRDLPSPRVVPYFNGGLFTEAVSLTLGSEQTVALTKAAEANWTYVDPHIFGSVFQGIMGDAERHASGAHYTAHDDIMRVVGPTIVEPWRKRIIAASTLKELTELRAELFRFRVLDPACGSGNFLYVAFREMYRLDTELLSRMREFRSTAGKLSWNGGIAATNFYGIDINPFAVELAKVTLNIAKKIAFEERKEAAYALAGQVEIDLDPSLPLDNLDENIVCKDALFTDWPEVDAIVGNPPMLGDRKIRGELGAEYVERLKAITDGALVDLSCYWFRKSHDRLAPGRRAGLVGTSGIRVGKARESSLDYIVSNGGTIASAVSSREWPGDAALNVSMVNWIRGRIDGDAILVVGDQSFCVATIPTHLGLDVDVSPAMPLRANEDGTSRGLIFGHKEFVFSASDPLLSPLLGKAFVRPMATGAGMLTGDIHRDPGYGIVLVDCGDEAAAKAVGGAAFDWLARAVLPSIRKLASTAGKTPHYARWLNTWWQPLDPRRALLAEIGKRPRYIACSQVLARPIFSFMSQAFAPSDSVQVFTFDDDYAFGILQSTLHWKWTKAKGGRVRADIRYTTEVWRTFAWPQAPNDDQIAAVAEAGRALRRTRERLMAENGWSLRQLHQAAETDGPHPLKVAQTALDAAVRAAYGAPDDQGDLDFLLELNQLVAEDEAAGRKVRGPGLPDHLDPNDPRWTSTDCIEPPPAD